MLLSFVNSMIFGDSCEDSITFSSASMGIKPAGTDEKVNFTVLKAYIKEE